MVTTPNNSAAGQYKTVDTETGVSGASPHRLIQMLLDGALGKIAMAKGAMQRGEIQEKGNHITSTAAIIVGLRDSLDMDAGGELARNLDDLYDYMVRRLMDAHLNNDLAGLDEVASLVQEIKRGWDAIPQEAINGGQVVPSATGV
jgi:flagellar protein FliS